MANLSRSDQKRIDILKGAGAEFVEHGYDGASMDRIAERAQVSKRTVYNHFSSKEVLFKQLAKETCQYMDRVTVKPYDPNRTLTEQLTEFATKSWKIHSTEKFSNAMRIIVATFMLKPELAREAMDEVMSLESAFYTWVKDAIRDGRFRDCDLHVAGKQFWGMTMEFVFWNNMFKESMPRFDMESSIASCVEMFLNYYEIK